MASCNLCSSFGPSKMQYNYDLATAHAETHFLQLKMIDDGIDRNQIFGQCFPDFAPVNAGAGDPGRRVLNAFCQSLFGRTSITSHIICEKCDGKLKITDGKKYLRSTVLIDHACYHLELNTYECCHCIRVFRCRNSMSVHLVEKHNLRTRIGHYRSKMDDFVGEISAMIKACFGGKKRAAHSNGETITTACVAKVCTRITGSRLAEERKLFYYRLIRKVADRNENIECRLCSNKIRTRIGKYIRCEPIREHAYCHLPTPLYRCRLCSEACFTRSALQKHLRAVHAQPYLEQNYECLADQYHSEVLAIMNKCYGNENDSAEDIPFRNLSDSKICRKSTRSKLADQRRLLIYRFIRKCASADGLAQCQLCSKRIGAKASDCFKTKRVMEHAYLHLGKKLYQCNNCANNFVTRDGVLRHLKNVHALPVLTQTCYRSLADQYHGDIVRIFRQCYGGEEEQEEEEAFEEAPTSVKHESIESISLVPSKLTIERQALCNQLVREHCDPKDKMLQCRLCSKRICVKKRNGVSGGVAMMHALTHLSKPIYRCKICAEMFTTRKSVGNHLGKEHALPYTNNYECFGDQYHTDIVEILRKCYNKEAATGQSKPFTSRTRAEAAVRACVNGSKQAVERQLCCYRLIRKYINSDGKVECRLCKKRIAAKIKEYHCSSNGVMMHAMVHLKKPIYRCKICSERFSYLALIKKHLKKTHDLPSTNNYDSLADEYHSEILAKLRECYGEL